MTPAEQIKERILSLESALLSQHPTMPALLREIHTNLKTNPDVVTLLDESEIAIIVKGLQVQTKTEIATTALKSTKARSAKGITLDML